MCSSDLLLGGDEDIVIVGIGHDTPEVPTVGLGKGLFCEVGVLEDEFRDAVVDSFLYLLISVLRSVYRVSFQGRDRLR